MLGCSKLVNISTALQKTKGNSLPFGGLYVLFTGDFHQLPPVRDTALYHGTTATDIDLLRRKIFGHPQGPNLMDTEWTSGPLVTPRNAMRQASNNQAALRPA